MLPSLHAIRASSRAIPRTSRAFSATSTTSQQIHDASEHTFNSHVANTKDKIVLAKFYEDWCPPCKVLAPLLERIEGDPSLVGAQALDLITLQAEKGVPNLAAKYKVYALPTVFAFKNGIVIGQFTGALGLPQIKSWFSTLEK
ncbi:thioredoxin-like protein [Ramaria rubella]|nr:thioredoxin-like protein [Ramaria rubella]